MTFARCISQPCFYWQITYSTHNGTTKCEGVLSSADDAGPTRARPGYTLSAGRLVYSDTRSMSTLRSASSTLSLCFASRLLARPAAAACVGGGGGNGLTGRRPSRDGRSASRLAARLTMVAPATSAPVSASVTVICSKPSRQDARQERAVATFAHDLSCAVTNFTHLRLAARTVLYADRLNGADTRNNERGRAVVKCWAHIIAH